MQNHGRLLPLELVHQIFDCLSTTDILQSFSNINTYFDSAISYYNRYHVNFQSCLKINFDRICSRIHPNQIVSLILSNKDDTPNQFQSILSQWNIEELSRLRAITLVDIENDLSFKFIDTLNNQYLQVLRIIPGDYSQKTLPKNGLQKLLAQRLERLDVYNANCIDTQSICNLKYLIVHDCEITKLQQILSSMPLLQSLQVINCTGDRWITMNKMSRRLKRLALNLDIRVSMTDIEEFLLNLPKLKHLELQIKGNLYDLCNAEQWSAITKQLLTFDFDFQSNVDITTSSHVFIDPFFSSFWREEKQWFVAYDRYPSHVFTVPRFATTHAYYSNHSSFHIPEYSTVSFDQTLFYDRINNLKILNELNESILSHRFMHVKILSITTLKLLDQLQFILDLTQICCLKLTNAIITDDLGQIIPNKLPRTYELHLCTLSKGFHRRLNGIKQIHTLHIQTVNNPSQLCRQFPCLERLYIGDIKSYRSINYIVDHLKAHLSYLSLSWSFENQSRRSVGLTKNLVQRNQQEFNSIYRCHNRYRSTLHLWINSSTEQLPHTRTTNICSQWLFNGLAWLSLHSRLPTV